MVPLETRCHSRGPSASDNRSPFLPGTGPIYRFPSRASTMSSQSSHLIVFFAPFPFGVVVAVTEPSDPRTELDHHLEYKLSPIVHHERLWLYLRCMLRASPFLYAIPAATGRHPSRFRAVRLERFESQRNRELRVGAIYYHAIATRPSSYLKANLLSATRHSLIRSLFFALNSAVTHSVSRSGCSTNELAHAAR